MANITLTKERVIKGNYIVGELSEEDCCPIASYLKELGYTSAEFRVTGA